MKSKFIVLALATVVSVSAVQSANAQNSAVGVSANAEVSTQVKPINELNVRATSSTAVRGNATSSIANNNSASTTRGNATSTMAKNNNATTTRGNATSTANMNDKLTSEDHRSVVSTFVKSLLAVADRDGGIGAEVRTVAQSQNDSVSTTVTAIAEVDERGSFRTFLAGSDYKNLGVIRKDIVNTSANIAKTKVLLSQAISAEDRAELSVQIKALENEQVKMEAFVKANEDKFSLFGWFNRLFID